MIDVGAVGISRSVRDFQIPVGAVLCVHRDGSVHIVFSVAKLFKCVIDGARLEKGDTRIATPLEKIAPGAS